MKIFAIYAKVELTKKPEWLDGFRIKYDKPYPYHITLKPSTIAKEAQVNDIKAKLANLFSTEKISDHRILLKFNSLNIRRDTNTDICIMINAEKNEVINKLQKDILLTLGDYNNYKKEKYKSYAENFQPHITIGRDLTEDLYLESAKELEKDYTCEGFIEEIILVVVNNANVTEANNPNNQTIYKL